MTAMNREEWLLEVAQEMAPWFGGLPSIRIAIGFPSKGSKGKAIGECWDRRCSGDQHNEILIRPDLADPEFVAAVLAHELIHAKAGLECGHRGAFRKMALQIGLEGKMTATVPGEAFKRSFAPILEKVGPLPHAALRFEGRSSGPKKQGTRMIKAVCTECGYTVRVARKWVDEKGAPHCPEHGQMEVEGGTDGDETETEG